MEWLNRLQEYLKNLENQDLYKNFGAFLAMLFLLLSMAGYLHYRRVRRYTSDLKNIENLRADTRRIINNYKAVTAQRQKVEELLAQNKNFRIAEAYQAIVQKLGLFPRLKDAISPAIGETTSGKTEVTVTSQFSGISMKNLTDLLAQIASVPQLYTKDIHIKKTPQAQAVDLDITTATLEPGSAE
ncbi:hypothetical protein H0X06_00715 [Candidatus Dependentiae bacterium]|nr:hypothetical protein [Candidatus Dependentiae bacterium]